MKRNREIRNTAREKNVLLWELAEHLGYVDTVFSRKLRHEFSPQATREVLKAIDELHQKKLEAKEEQWTRRI